MKLISELIEGRPLIHVQSSEKVRDVARTMTERKIGAVAVLDNETLVGLFSERDLMTRVVAASLDPDKTPVSAVMTREIAVATPLDDVAICLEKMNSIGCRHLPVVDRGALIGMISLRDLLDIDSQSSRARATFLTELVTYSPDYES